jgi:Zn-dependent M28 family amino/carboxypeptidase
MIKFLFNIVLVFFCFSASAQSNITNNDTSIITRNSLFETISFLSSDKMKGRFTGTIEVDSAAEYIARKFEEVGLYPIINNKYYFQDFIIPTNKGNVKATNVMGIIPRKDSTQDSIIIISAHYDHIGNGNIGAMKTIPEDTIYNGANDNAAGVAAIIEIAKYYNLLNENKYNVLFIAFAAEEWGLVGSNFENSLLDGVPIKAVINIDMIGRPMSRNNKKCMVISDNSRKIIKVLNNSLKSNVKFFIEDQFPLEYLNKRADHASFTSCKNSFTLTCTSPKDEFYHAPNDTIETLDFSFLAITVKNIAEACRVFIK